MEKSRVIYTILFLFTLCFSFSISSHAQVTETYCSTDVPVNIPNSGQAPDSVLNLPDVGEVEDIVVKMYIEHTCRADLEASLTSPDNTTIVLFDVDTGCGDDYGSQCQPLPNFILDDSASEPVSDIPVEGGPVTGAYRPQDPLSSFLGEDLSGQWTLSIFDDSGGDDGVLECWCIEITLPAEGCCVTGLSDCMTTTENECAAEGGEYQGDGVSCSDIQACNTRPIPTISEWGMLALTVVLGASAVLYLMLRRRNQAV